MMRMMVKDATMMRQKGHMTKKIILRGEGLQATLKTALTKLH